MTPWLQLGLAAPIEQRPAGADDDVAFTESPVDLLGQFGVLVTVRRTLPRLPA
jgi:hypothetical protein